MFLGFAGEGFKQEEQALMKVGRAVDSRPFRDSPRRAARDRRRAEADGDRAGEPVPGWQAARDARAGEVVLQQARDRSRRRKSRFGARRPRTCISSSPDFDASTQSGNLHGDHQPAGQLDLVWLCASWRWDGHRASARARVRVCDREDSQRRGDDEPGASDSPAAAGGFAQASTVPRGARCRRGATVPDSKTALRKQIEGDIMCTCGCRVAMATCPMGPSCHGLQTLSAKLDALSAKGMTREQIRDAMVADHGGQDILTSPIDTGFNRLAWFFPYAIGVVGAVGIVVAAKRWSRHDGVARAPRPHAAGRGSQRKARG